LLGAWVNPGGSLTQTTRVTAVHGLQSAIGRKLDIVNTYRRMTDTFPMTSDYRLTAGGATLMVSWATPPSKDITSGADDAQITAWARRFASFPHPVMVRMRWEMDRPNLGPTMGSGADFVAAWKHVRAIFAAQHVTNVSWVWCPTANGFATGVAPSFYPGDGQVDWTCVDVYSATQLQPLSTLLSPYLRWATAHPKPIVIGEFGIADAYAPSVRSEWLSDAAAEFQSDPQIKAVCYFDSDPAGAVPQQSFALPGGSAALTAFRALARLPYFNSR
ncbi:MAG TPA: endoglucanase, partial [Micromonosporaceae bacterium]